jgi:hypothetical protein
MQSILSSEPPKPPPRPMTRPVATDTSQLFTHKDIACGSNEMIQNRDTSTDTDSLVDLQDRASGLDIPRELLSRHTATDTRTLISIRDNFTTTIPITQTALVDAQTQSINEMKQDASSNTLALAEQRHASVQVCVVVIHPRMKIMIRSFLFRQDTNNQLSSITPHRQNQKCFINLVIYVIRYPIRI